MIEKYLSVFAILTAVVVAVYVYRELNYTKAKLGELKYLKNEYINMDSRLNKVETMQEANDANNIELEDSSSDGSNDYDAFESDSDSDSDDPKEDDSEEIIIEAQPGSPKPKVEEITI